MTGILTHPRDVDHSKGRKPNVLLYFVHRRLYRSLFLKQSAFEENFDRVQAADRPRQLSQLLAVSSVPESENDHRDLVLILFVGPAHATAS